MNKEDMPDNIKKLPVNEEGVPVAWHMIADGKPKLSKMAEAFNHKLCWLCGQTLGAFNAFLAEPISMINRTVKHPPSHVECVLYAVKNPQGSLIEKANVIMVWVTKKFYPFQDGKGILFKVGDPEDRFFYSNGQAATAKEVALSIQAELPAYRALAEKQGPEALEKFEKLSGAVLDAFKVDS